MIKNGVINGSLLLFLVRRLDSHFEVFGVWIVTVYGYSRLRGFIRRLAGAIALNYPRSFLSRIFYPRKIYLFELLDNSRVFRLLFDGAVYFKNLYSLSSLRRVSVEFKRGPRFTGVKAVSAGICAGIITEFLLVIILKGGEISLSGCVMRVMLLAAAGILYSGAELGDLLETSLFFGKSDEKSQSPKGYRAP